MCCLHAPGIALRNRELHLVEPLFELLESIQFVFFKWVYQLTCISAVPTLACTCTSESG